MNLSIFSFSFILFLHFSKVGILKFEILKYKRTKLSSIIQANIIKQCYFNEWKLWIQISRRVIRINEFLEAKGNDDESMNFIWKTVSRIVSSRWGNNRCERLAKVFLKFERTNFLGPRRGKVANSWAKFCNDSRCWEVCTGRDIGWKGLVLKRGGASFIRNAFPVARTIRILIVVLSPSFARGFDRKLLQCFVQSAFTWSQQILWYKSTATDKGRKCLSRRVSRSIPIIDQPINQ